MAPLAGKGIWTLYEDIERAITWAPQVGARYILAKVSNAGVYSPGAAQTALNLIQAAPGLVPVAWMYNYLNDVNAEADCIARALAAGFEAMILDAEADINLKFAQAEQLVQRLQTLGVDPARLYLCSDPRLDAKIDEIPTPILAKICRGGFIPMIYGEILPNDRPNAAKRVMQAAYDQYDRHQAELNYASALMPAISTCWDDMGAARMDYNELKLWCDEAAQRQPQFVTLFRANVTRDDAWQAFKELKLPIAAGQVDDSHIAQLDFPLLGLHDIEGGEWLAQEGKRGWCVDTVELGLNSRQLDYTALAQKDIRVLVRLNHGYGATGTLPVAAKYSDFAAAVIQTIHDAKGAYAFILGNEPNNPNEWPGGPQGGQPITPEQYGLLWNMVWWKIPKETPVIVAAVDPYNAVVGDARDYWARMLQAIFANGGQHAGGADGLAFHPKLQWHDKALVRSGVTFTNAPLLDVPYNWRAWESVLAVTPGPFQKLPLYLTECNPQRQTANGPLGWRADDQGVIGEMLAYEREMEPSHGNRVRALVLYRWGQADEFAMENKPGLVAAVKAALA